MATGSDRRTGGAGRRACGASGGYLRVAGSALALGLAWGLASGCGAKNDDDPRPSESLPGLAAIDDGAAGSGDSVSPTREGPQATIARDASGSCTIEVDGTKCAEQYYEGETVPLDIYILFDQSGSMCNCIDPPKLHNECPDPECNMSRMEAVRLAIDTFLRDENSAGINVGIGYFGQQPIGETTCDPADYAQSAVGIDALPDHADAIMESLAGREPTGETPTGPAIQAACSIAQDWKREHPSHQVVLLLLTDGEPKAPVTCQNDVGPCCPTLVEAVARTEQCRTGNPSIQTYVLGVGPFLGSLHDIAEAGGTAQAYLVDDSDTSADGGSVSVRVLDALNAIRRAALPCELTMPFDPQGRPLAYDKVNIFYADPECNGYVYPYVDAPSSCTDDGGWYYDDPEAPEVMHLCPSSCKQVEAPGGVLVQAVGCDTFKYIL